MVVTVVGRDITAPDPRIVFMGALVIIADALYFSVFTVLLAYWCVLMPLIRASPRAAS